MRIYRRVCVDSYHFMVTATIRQKIKQQNKSETEKLNNPNILINYTIKKEKQLIELRNHTTNLESKWPLVK